MTVKATARARQKSTALKRLAVALLLLCVVEEL